MMCEKLLVCLRLKLWRGSWIYWFQCNTQQLTDLRNWFQKKNIFPSLLLCQLLKRKSNFTNSNFYKVLSSDIRFQRRKSRKSCFQGLFVEKYFYFDFQQLESSCLVLASQTQHPSVSWSVDRGLSGNTADNIIGRNILDKVFLINTFLWPMNEREKFNKCLFSL